MSAGHAHLALFLSGLSGGGAQRRMLTLAREFARRGHRVDVVVPSPEGPFRAEIAPPVRLVALNAGGFRFPGPSRARGPKVMASTPALAGYLRRERPDVVLSTSNPANLAALWARALARTHTPVVVSVNVHLGEATGTRQKAWGPVLRGLLRRFYPSADGIIAISDGVAADFARRIDVPIERITTIHNPIAVEELQARADETLDHPWLAAGSPPVLLAVGKLKIQKDLATLLRAFARIRAQREARLVILGEGEERGSLERLARDLGIAADVVLPGFTYNPFAWMGRASVFVLSSAWEGFSNALSEALACGCPVVSTDCPSGPAEILDGGRYGPLVPVADDRALAAAVQAVLDSPPPADRQRARAAEFSVDAAVDRYLEVLLRTARGADEEEGQAGWMSRRNTLQSSFTR